MLFAYITREVQKSFRKREKFFRKFQLFAKYNKISNLCIDIFLILSQKFFCRLKI